MKAEVKGLKRIKQTSRNVRTLASAIDAKLAVAVRAKKTRTNKGYAGKFTNKQFEAKTKQDRARVKEIRKEMGFERTASENASLYREHAGEGRNPLFLASNERKRFVKRIFSAFRKQLKKVTVAKWTVSSERGRIETLMDSLGKSFVLFIRGHINRSISKNGRMRPNPKRYRDSKVRKFGKGSGRPLVATGQLRRSIYHEVKKHGD